MVELSPVEPCCVLCTLCKKLTHISNPVQSVEVNEKAEIDHPLVD
jgi:hypothetical protein